VCTANKKLSNVSTDSGNPAVDTSAEHRSVTVSGFTPGVGVDVIGVTTEKADTGRTS
jgi:hypothetical protein